MTTVYLNGEYLPLSEAKVSVNDRGFLFSDGVYEVTPAYGGRLFRMDRHLARLERGLRELRIAFDPDGIEEVHTRLLATNGLDDRDIAYVYVQVTRGVAVRGHAFPVPDAVPTVYAFAKEHTRPPRALWEEGFQAATVPDRRWARVDLKTIGLLPNVLAQQAAVEAGATDALLVKDGIAIEGAHSNFFAVVDGTLLTHPVSNVILPGITREIVLELARRLDVPVEERPIQLEELAHAEEAFFTGTTTEVRPTVRIDGRPVGSGRPGPVARLLYEAFLEAVSSLGAAAGRV